MSRVLKFARYIHHYKILPRNILGLVLKNKMITTDISLKVIKEVYIF